jgi:hypothetical protein
MSEKTQIVDYFLPNLTAGKYTVEVVQKVIDIKNSKTTLQEVKKQLDFAIDAARFTLNSDDIYSVYPPANTTGDYQNHFPHVVFNRRTLPWERTIDGKPENSENTRTPWMALLLLDEEEMKSCKIEPTDLKEVLYQEDLTDPISRPEISGKESKKDGLKVMDWEEAEQKCFTIDITKEQFQAYIPKTTELPFLAHSKIVTITHKDPNGIGDTQGDQGYFSTLLGSRFIKRGMAYTALVVSLEGHKKYIENPALLKTKVRMVVLAHWKFTSDGATSFGTLVNQLQVQSFAAQTPTDALKEYVKFGYIPMRHSMRNGAKNISWYRGPFVPHETYLQSDKLIQFSNSDTALYYDTDTGMMDVSIASAWELGRIVALQNQEFTKAMIEWINNPFTDDTPTKSEINKTKVINWLENKLEEATDDMVDKPNKSFKEFPTVVSNFLKDLAALKYVPLAYLIPDKKYLTTHTDEAAVLSLFYLDFRWLYALLDGAVNITNAIALDTKTQVVQILNDTYNPTGSTSITTGFLLHSKLVSGWRGLEIKAFESDTLLDNPIRFERITSAIFLGIFSGTINKIVLKQPYEGLHFGVKEKEAGSSIFEKALKEKEGKTDEKNKIEIKQNDILKESQVISIEKLTKKYKDISKKDDFSTADFAYQMVDSPVEATFNLKK